MVHVIIAGNPAFALINYAYSFFYRHETVTDNLTAKHGSEYTTVLNEPASAAHWLIQAYLLQLRHPLHSRGLMGMGDVGAPGGDAAVVPLLRILPVVYAFGVSGTPSFPQYVVTVALRLKSRPAEQYGSNGQFAMRIYRRQYSTNDTTAHRLCISPTSSDLFFRH